MIKFIADIGSNHGADIDRAVRLIEEAKRAGCSAAKFQLFDASLTTNAKTAAVYERRALPIGFLPRLRGACDAEGIEFHLTVTSYDTLEEGWQYAHALKIGSYEILHLELIKLAAGTGKPLSISTGGATPWEVKAAIIASMQGGHDLEKLILYHCSPLYPAAPETCGLNSMDMLRAHGVRRVGWSDHTVKPGVIYAAIGHGAEYIELHMDLDGLDGWESEHGHCWEASRVRRLIKTVRDGEEALKGSVADYADMRLQRTDPGDGRRPLKAAR